MTRSMLSSCAVISFLTACATASTGGGTSTSSSSSVTYATFRNPSGVAIQAGICNCADDIIYVADYQSVRMIQGATVTTLAGPTDASSGGQCPTGYVDATGTAARFNYISAIVIDPNTGNLYVTEHMNDTVRRITPAGVVTTVAGQGPIMTTFPMSPSVDGVGTAANFKHPSGITIDPTGTYLYVADSYDYSIRRITIATGQVETVIGGQYMFPTVPSSVRLSNPVGIWFQAGSPNLIYIIDQGYSRVRFFDPSIYAGVPLNPSVLSIMPSPASFSFNHPVGLLVDPGNNIYLTEGNGSATSNQIRSSAVAGSHPVVAGGVGAGDLSAPVGANARFDTPAGIAWSPHGVLYIADSRNQQIRRMGRFPPWPVDVRAGHAPGHPQGCMDGAA